MSTYLSGPESQPRSSAPQSARTGARRDSQLALSPDGRYLARIADGDAILRDLASGLEHTLARAAAEAMVVFADQVWVFDLAEPAGCLRIRRTTLAGVPIDEALITELTVVPPIHPVPFGSAAAVLQGAAPIEVRDDCGRLVAHCLGQGLERVVPVGPRSWIVRRERALWIRRPHGDLALAIPPELLDSAVVAGGGGVLDGAAVVIALASQTTRTLVVCDARRGTLMARVRLEGPRLAALATRRGHAVLDHGGGELGILDVRTLRTVGRISEDRPVDEVAIDAAGTQLALRFAGGAIGLTPCPGHERPAADRRWIVAPPEADHGDEPAPISTSTPVDPTGGSAPRALGGAEVASPAPHTPEGVLDRAAPEPLPDGELHALGPRGDRTRGEAESARGGGPAAETDRPGGAGAVGPRRIDRLDERETAAYLADTFTLLAARCRRAVAAGWDSGRIAEIPALRLPFDLEVAAILDGVSGRAPDALASAQQREAEAVTAWTTAWRQRGPLAELAADHGLSPLAAELLLIAAAPRMFGELARVFAVIANDVARPLCDEVLIAQILGAAPGVRVALAAELDDGAPLVRCGLVRRNPAHRPFAELVVPTVVVRRLQGAALPATGTAIELRAASAVLDELLAPRGELARLLGSLARPSPEPARIVVRGPLGSGRRTLAAALAARAGRPLAVIDAALLEAPMAERLAEALLEVLARGWLPMVTGIDGITHDPGLRDAVRGVLRDHPGPLLVRTSLDAALPLDPGHVTIALPPIREAERAAVWRDRLARRGLPVIDADRLASRYAVGPGIIAQVADALEVEPDADVAEQASAVMRQHRERRIGHVARRVERLATWSNLVLPEEVIDSLRELVSRVRHRRTVLDTWGFDRIMSTSRGLTALFQGGPGTGKTLVAGVIARELGYELYRIDLANLMSKWIGETEKNIAGVFDAAEGDDVVLLFDEADALFTRRTEVKSSVDRYANAEVNYLLQRLDSFDGVAILTTNFGTAIDPAVKRRLSYRLTFPFPDEESRERLWRVHLPRELPTHGELGLGELARRFRLSGGYIRNAALRAAYLAAQDDLPLGRDHLERAVRLEFREVGLLSDDGKLE